MTAELAPQPLPGPARPTQRFWAWSALAYIAVNLPFLILTLDTYNLNGDIYSSSYLWLGLNPYHAATNVGQGYLILPGAGYFVLPYNMVAFLAYPAFGFNAIAASAALKVIGVAAGYLAARVVYEIAHREGRSNPKTYFYAVLFNPFLIFVNSIAGDADLIVVMLVFLAVFLFRYGWSPKVNLPAVIFGATAVSLTVLTYYFTLLFVPTLILWIEGRRNKLLAIVLMAAVLVVFGLPIVGFGLGSVNTSSLLSTVQITGYSFPYYLTPSWTALFATNQRVFTALAAVLAIVIPVVFRRWNIGQGTTLLTVLATAFALTFRLPADVFAILAALVPLAFALSRSSSRVGYWRMMLFQVFLVPVYLLVQMFNGPGQVTGIYYWLYPYLHQNVILYNTLGKSPVAQGLFAAYTAGTIATIVALVWLERRAARGTSEIAAMTPPPRPLRPAPVSRRALIGVVVVGALLVTVPIAIAYATPNGTPLESHQQLNTQDFYAYDVQTPLLYPLAGPNTYSVDSSAGTLSIFGQAPPIGFARNIAETTNRVNLTVSVKPSSNVGPVPVWQTNQSEVLFSSMLTRGPGEMTWTPVTTQGLTPTTSQIPPISGTTLVYAMAGDHALEYQEPPAALSGRQEFFAAQFNGNSSSKNTLWTAFFNPESAAEGYLNGGYLYLATESGANWTIARIATSAVEGQWFLTGFEFDTDTDRVSAFVNNAGLSLPLNLSSSGDYTVFLGKYNLSSEFDQREAWIGNLTSVYSLTPAEIGFVSGFYAATAGSPEPVLVGDGDSVTIQYYSSGSRGSLQVNSTNLTFGAADSLMLFGKLAASPASVDFSVHEMYFVRANPGVDFGWVVVGFGVLLPAWVFVWCGRELWKPLRRTRPR